MLVLTIKISDCLTENIIKKQVKIHYLPSILIVSSESRVSFSVHFRYKGEQDCTLIGNTQTQHINQIRKLCFGKTFHVLSLDV